MRSEGGELFHEVYGSYYHTVALILREAVQGTLTKRRLSELVSRFAFAESYASIPEGLTGEGWRLLHRDLSTPLCNEPQQPITLLQRRWLKALLADPRMSLFDPPTEGLEDVEPLFTPDMFVAYDQYGNGDDYTDAGYRERFRTILIAIREKRFLRVCYRKPSGGELTLYVTPHILEYSEKDDCFRLIASAAKRDWVLRLSRLQSCEPVDGDSRYELRPRESRELEFTLIDEHNALERVLLHFSHLEKETRRVGEKEYRVRLVYDPQDETEMVIRMLSFGPRVQVTAPESFRKLMRRRVLRQAALLPQA